MSQQEKAIKKTRINALAKEILLWSLRGPRTWITVAYAFEMAKEFVEQEDKRE